MQHAEGGSGDWALGGKEQSRVTRFVSSSHSTTSPLCHFATSFFPQCPVPNPQSLLSWPYARTYVIWTWTWT
jgi:hypothetical protein